MGVGMNRSILFSYMPLGGIGVLSHLEINLKKPQLLPAVIFEFLETKFKKASFCFESIPIKCIMGYEILM